MTVFIPDENRRFRIDPPTVGATSYVVILAVWNNGRRTMEMHRTSVPLRWDASKSDWVLHHSSPTEDVSAEVWSVIGKVAKYVGWSLPEGF